MWNEVCENLIWTTNDFFSSSTMNSIDEFISAEIKHVTAKSNKETPPLISDSAFHYKMITKTPQQLDSVYGELKMKLNTLWTQNREPLFPQAPMKVSQAMFKFFTPESLYALHTEDTAIFGHWVYVIYLTTEDSGELYFPSQAAVFTSIENSELTEWKKMISYLENKKSKVFYCPQDYIFVPKKNKAIAFRVGLAHKVFPLLNKEMGRFCLTGWPFTTFK